MLKEKLEQDLIESMKAKDELKLSVLRILKSAIKNHEIQKKSVLEDIDIVQVIQSQIKSRRDSIDMFTKGNRPELAEKEQAEIEILKVYLPVQLEEANIRDIVSKAIIELNATNIQDMGKVMAKIMPEVKGKADGSLVSQIVKEELNKSLSN